MIKDKILVFSSYNIKENSGGPSGYIYKCLLNNLPKEMILLQEELFKNQGSLKFKIKNKISYICSLLYNNKRNSNVIKFISSNSFNFKYIFFHDVFTLSSVLHLLKNDQVILLQSHSPELPSEEEFKVNKDYKNFEKNKIEERSAFERANMLIFPNKECEYIYKELLCKHHQIKYLQTGIKKISSTIQYPIKQDKINLLYIGRRNEIKGYDLLIKIFKKAIKERGDLRLFIAGKGEEVDQEDIYDLGMITTSYNWINSVDFVFSLNKQSYFDLNVIETICLGTPLIMTTTEGHQFFKNRKGIVDVTKDTLLDTLLDVNIISKDFKNDNNLVLKGFYKQFFTSDMFKKNLEAICKDVLKK